MMPERQFIQGVSRMSGFGLTAFKKKNDEENKEHKTFYFKHLVFGDGPEA